MDDPLFPLNDLGRRMTIHLRDEEAELLVLLERVTAVRQALLSRDIDRLQAANDATEVQRHHHQQFAHKRLAICQAMASRLRLTGDRIPLLRFLPYIEPTIRHQLVEQRRSLRSVTQSIERINRANLAFIRRFGELLDEACDRLTGRVRSGCYGHNGRVHSPAPVSLFQTDC